MNVLTKISLSFSRVPGGTTGFVTVTLVDSTIPASFSSRVLEIYSKTKSHVALAMLIILQLVFLVWTAIHNYVVYNDAIRLEGWPHFRGHKKSIIICDLPGVIVLIQGWPLIPGVPIITGNNLIHCMNGGSSCHELPPWK